MRSHERFVTFRAGLLGLATLSALSCTADPTTDTAAQSVVNVPLPPLNLVLNAKTTVTIGPFAQVFGDVASTALNGSVLFDVSAQQGFGSNTLAAIVNVRTSASVGHIFGDDITVDGFALAQTLGLDPSQLPAVPAATTAPAGGTAVSVATNQTKQLCPGQYGAITLAANATLNLNGGVYQVTRLSLGDGARLEPSEPVVILVTGNLTTTAGAAIAPSSQALNPMSAKDIRIELGGSATVGDGSLIHAHLLVPNGKLTVGKNAALIGAAWAKSIAIGAHSFASAEDAFAAHAPVVPPPCNDNSVCTTDVCVGGGTAVAFCRNTASPSGTSCGDGDACNGQELCDGAGTCQPGAIAPAGTSCADGDACNGDEVCNGFGSCLSGAPPVVDDGNTCTTDSCDPAAGVSHIDLPDGTTCAATGVCTAGTCSVQAHTLFTINDFTGRLERIDPDTLSITDVGPLGVPYAFGDCMFNPSDNTLYMVDGRGAQGLYRVDLTTGAATLVGFHGVSAMEAIAFHPPTHTIFGTSIDVLDLFSLSATTGAATAIGPIGSNFQGMAWDSKRNLMMSYDGSTMFTLDVATGAMTPLASAGPVANFGMTYDPVLDRFWVVDFGGELLQLDPNANFATTLRTFLPGGRTCIASVPVP